MLLMLIAIFLFASLGQAFGSQRSNKDIFGKDLKGMQRAKGMLSSNQANLSMNPQKSETNDRSAFERFSVSISNDGPALTISSFLSQLTVVPTSRFSHFHVPNDGPASTISSFLSQLMIVPTSSSLHYVPTKQQVPLLDSPV